jgi:hypothetical protein
LNFPKNGKEKKETEGVHVGLVRRRFQHSREKGPPKKERDSKDPVISAWLRIIYLLADGMYDLKTDSCLCRRQWKKGVAGVAGRRGCESHAWSGKRTKGKWKPLLRKAPENVTCTARSITK